MNWGGGKHNAGYNIPFVAGGDFVAPCPNPEHITHTLKKLGGGHQDFFEMLAKKRAPCQSQIRLPRAASSMPRMDRPGPVAKGPNRTGGIGTEVGFGVVFPGSLCGEWCENPKPEEQTKSLCLLKFFYRQNMLFLGITRPAAPITVTFSNFCEELSMMDSVSPGFMCYKNRGWLTFHIRLVTLNGNSTVDGPVRPSTPESWG